ARRPGAERLQVPTGVGPAENREVWSGRELRRVPTMNVHKVKNHADQYGISHQVQEEIRQEGEGAARLWGKAAPHLEDKAVTDQDGPQAAKPLEEPHHAQAKGAP